MKKTYPVILLISLALLTSFSVAASFLKAETPKSVTIDSADYKLGDFMNLAIKDLVKSTGRKIGIFDQISLFKIRLDMKKVLKKEPNISVSEYYSRVKNRRMGTGGVILIGLGAGVLILIILFLVALSKWHE
jgi:galactitol-specific phosphotransferase system IIC component